MLGSNVLGIIYSNAYDESLSELTSFRTMGSVPFAGRYRLIDFVLSGMVNSGITKVGITTNSNYRSLMDHLGSGIPWDLSRKREGMTILPPFNLNEGAEFDKTGTRISILKGIMGYIADSSKEYVLLSDCNLASCPDYDDMIEGHINSGADITIACQVGKAPALHNTMVFDLDEDRIKRVKISPVTDEDVCYSINVILMKRVLLERLINGVVSHSGSSFEADVIQRNVEKLDMRAYKVKSYTRTIDSLKSYFDISMDLVNGGYKELFSPDKIVYTKVRDYMPSIYGIGSSVNNSLVADGCIIKGRVENCILFRGVRIDAGAVVKNSVIMQDSYIGADAKINCAILDKDVVIKPGRELSGAETYPIYIGKGIIV